MTTEKKPAPTRRYVVTDHAGKDHLVKATSPADAILQIYKPAVRVASGDDIERLVKGNAP